MIEFKSFESLGFIIDTVPEDIFNFLKSEAYNAKKENNIFNQKLVGNLNEQYFIEIKNKKEFEYFENYLFYLIRECEKKHQYLEKYVNFLSEPLDCKLHEVWVNFQKKYEFNPIHHHPGVYSFVTYIQIPYKNEDENELFEFTKSSDKVSGCFQFVYSSNGKIRDYVLRTDYKYEGKIIVFPSELNHIVYPFFTSDNYRISVSGNIKMMSR